MRGGSCGAAANLPSFMTGPSKTWIDGVQTRAHHLKVTRGGTVLRKKTNETRATLDASECEDGSKDDHHVYAYVNKGGSDAAARPRVED